VTATISPPTSTASRLASHLSTPLFRTGYALIFSAIGTSGLGIVYWALAARFYSAGSVGLNSAAISAMMFLSGVSQLNLVGALIRFLPTAGRASVRLVTYSYLASVVVAGILGLALVVGQGVWTPVPRLFDDNVAFLLWFIVATMAWGVFALQDFVLAGLRQAVWVPIENMVFALIKIAAVVALAGSLPLYGIFISWTVPTLAAVVVMNALIFLRLLPRHVRQTANQAVSISTRKLASYIAGNYAGYLFFLASTTLLPVMVESVEGASAAGYFYLAWIFAYSLQLISQNMAASLTVEGALDEKRLEAYSVQVLTHVSRLVVPIVVVMLVGAPYILQVFGSNYDEHSAGLLRLLALATIPNIVNVVYVAIMRVRQRNRPIIVVQAVLCVSSLALSYVFLQTYGIEGVGLAWVISQTAVAAVLSFTELRPLVLPALVVRFSRSPR
jgi:O-antigen/teichoic acid export membrane protein